MKKEGKFDVYIKTSALLGDYVKNAFDEAIFRTYAAKNPNENDDGMLDYDGEESQEDVDVEPEDAKVESCFSKCELFWY